MIMTKREKDYKKRRYPVLVILVLQPFTDCLLNISLLNFIEKLNNYIDICLYSSSLNDK
jgi:hypothetical protein